MICKKRFPESLFNVHECSGAKSYDCDICAKTFPEKKGLAYHKRTHTGEKPYACGICKKTFRQNSHLTEHKRLHTREKPYSCDVCQKSYTRSSTLFKHNKTAAHIERMKSRNTDIPLTQSSFVDCGESIKEEDIKEEIKEEESVDDHASISYSTETYIKEEIKEEGKEVDEGQGVDDSNLDTYNLVDCSEYVQVQSNLTK